MIEFNKFITKNFCIYQVYRIDYVNELLTCKNILELDRDIMYFISVSYN